jgi:hypothetical protein
MKLDQTKRALRRHHKNRLINKMRRTLWWGRYREFESEAERREWLRRVVDNRKNCSCTMCCNPRRSPWSDNSLTFPELMQIQNLKEGLAELFSTESEEE